MEEFNIFYLGEMRLSEYFDQQKSQAMTSHMKSQLFSRIQKEKLIWTEVSTKLPSKIFFFASRKIMYASLAAVLVFVVFWWFLLDRNEIIDLWIFSIQRHINPNWVRADYVAEIIEFNWEYSLERDGVNLPVQDLKLIEDWDIITLLEWTDLLFNLTDWTQSKIVWPARFSVTKWERWYQVSLIDWKFFRIYCPDCTSEIDVITPDLSIHQDKNQVLDVHIAKEDDWKLLVKNEWDSITVTTKNWDNKEETKLTPTELVSLTQNSETIDILNDSDLMLLFMAKNDISATFSLSTEKVEWPTVDVRPSNDTLAMNTNIDTTDSQSGTTPTPSIDIMAQIEQDPLLEWVIDIISSDLTVVGEVDETISIDLWIETDWQQVPNPDQMQSLQNNLNSFFLMNLFESIYNEDKVNQNIWKLADRINAVASSFGYSDHARVDLANIKSVALTLKSKLEDDWYVSPSYILQLEKISNRCDELTNPSQDNWDTLKSNLPINLRLM